MKKIYINITINDSCIVNIIIKMLTSLNKKEEYLKN